MKRLTKYEPNNKNMFPYKLKDEELSTELDSIHKLGQLEDIEEEISIDLITLFKALKDGVWTKRLFYDSDWRRYHTFEEVNVVEKKSITIKTICCSDWTFENQHKEFIFEV